MSKPTFEQVLACPGLPTLPTIAVELLEMTRRPDVALRDIAKLVKGDIGLSAKVLKTINSSFFALKQPCLTIDRALAYMGLNTVKSLVLSFSLVDATKFVNDGEGFDLHTYWKRCIYAAAGARNFAEATRACDPDEAFTAAMFQDMGMMASFVALGTDYAAVALAAEDHDSLPQHELDSLGFTHATVGAELARRWRFTDAVVETVAWHHDPNGAKPDHQGLVRCVALGRLAAEAITSDTPAKHAGRLFARARDWFNHAREDVGVLVERISDGAQELARMLEKDISPLPDVGLILATANEQLVEHQMVVRAEADSLLQKSITDALTKAHNRTHFNEQLPALFAQCQSDQRPFAVLFSDADKFKSVNDSYGHPAGDAVLVELARRFNAVVADQGSVFRYGGEEFAILLPGSTTTQAAALAEKIRLAVEGNPFDLSAVDGAPPTLRVTVSLGVSASDRPGIEPGFTPAQLVHEADQAVYAAKKSGRNRVCTFGDLPAIPPAETSPAPAAPAPTAPAPASKVPARVDPAPHSKRRVLLIEDDALAAALLSMTLKRIPTTHVQWLRASSAVKTYAEGIAAGLIAPPKLILISLSLSSQPATEVIAVLRRIPALAQVPIMGLATSESPVDHQPALDAGATRCFTKLEIVPRLGAWAQELLPTPRAAAA